MTSRFAYLGPPATFAEQALLTLPAARVGQRVPATSVPDALDAVRAGEVDAALVPLENSVEGSVSVTLDELANGEPLVVTGEVVLPVGFSLLARSGTSLGEVTSVATHPHAEAQCRRWLRRTLPAATVQLALSTSEAAAQVARGVWDAALSSPLAARHYGLEVLAEDVHDTEGAVTRFVLVSRAGTLPARTGNDRTSLVVFIAEDRAGALLQVLTEFAVRGINLTRIESRPTRAQLGQYCFSIDCEGHLADARVGEALSALHRVCADVRFLGSYPRTHGTPTGQPAGTRDNDFAEAAGWLARLRRADPRR